MASVYTDGEIDRPKWTGLQKLSFLTLPVALVGVVCIWLAFFTLIYDAYVVSFGSLSYFDYVGHARFADAARYTWSIIHTRNTVGLSLLAFALASPFLFFLMCIWMLKGGRALSRKILYLLHVRSMFSLIAMTALIFAAAWAGAFIYGFAFYLVASKAGEHADIASYYGSHLAAMYQATDGPTDAAGGYQRPSRQTVQATLVGLAAACALVGFPIGAAIQKRQQMIMGKARLATLKDAADFRLRDKRGIVLGLKQGLLLRNDGDQHVMLIGSPGQGKSRGFVIPSMMSFEGSQVVLDMSGELFEQTSGFLRDKGFETFLLAPGSKFTDGYNPLDLISTDPHQRITDLQKLTQMLLPERLRSDSSDFWEESARILLTAMLGFVLECPDTRKSLSELYRILNSMSDERTAIVQLLENYEKVLSDQTRMQLTKFAGRHEKLGEGIAAEIVAKLNFLQNPLVEALTSITTIPIDPKHHSLNLAQAVAINAYEWRTLILDAPPPRFREGEPPASNELLVGMYEHFEAELEAGGFFHPPEKKPSMSQNLRVMLGRAAFTEQEVATMRGAIHALAKGRGRVLAKLAEKRAAEAKKGE